jgi:hypothetical protein
MINGWIFKASGSRKTTSALYLDPVSYLPEVSLAWETMDVRTSRSRLCFGSVWSIETTVSNDLPPVYDLLADPCLLDFTNSRVIELPPALVQTAGAATWRQSFTRLTTPTNHLSRSVQRRLRPRLCRSHVCQVVFYRQLMRLKRHASARPVSTVVSQSQWFWWSIFSIADDLSGINPKACHSISVTWRKGAVWCGVAWVSSV